MATHPLAPAAERLYRWAEVFRRTLFLGIVVAFMAASRVAMAGAWGDGSFENDDAMDWAATCAEARSIAPVREALERSLRGKYLEAPDGSEAVAAAEVVAAARRKPMAGLPGDLAAWVKRQSPAALAKLAPLALRALRRVRDPKTSELRQLWDQAKPEKWVEVITDLESRLR